MESLFSVFSPAYRCHRSLVQRLFYLTNHDLIKHNHQVSFRLVPSLAVCCLSFNISLYLYLLTPPPLIIDRTPIRLSHALTLSWSFFYSIRFFPRVIGGIVFLAGLAGVQNAEQQHQYKCGKHVYVEALRLASDQTCWSSGRYLPSVHEHRAIGVIPVNSELT
ncbi:hypothetical protein L873DRAFT_705756 [Choiromyces venosus 120613-1]|uniref:Uncharacterized protein n=1 Tax=Choiromyces venosus 120613-1 TaxID=1336337 RepID=A0A3N4ITV1_9PEZI|nr:hypothetical protein L873DRAFT_705756 [Choiromyces venosus 120613-1]